MSQFNSPAECCANASTWEQAVDNVVQYLVSQGACFSSGEVVSHIRTHRSDLVFRHGWVGERLQRAFANGTMPDYEGGPGIGTIHPVQMIRQTSGLGRTPAGVQVFVYAPDPQAGADHHFEVDVPLPGPQGLQDGRSAPPTGPLDGLSAAALAMMGGTVPAPTGRTPTPVPVGTAAAPATAKGKQVPGDVVAKVHADGRVCIPKLAFEALAQSTGQPVVGGVAIYATWKGQVVVLRQDQGLSTVYPTTDFCRVHLTPPSALPVGSEYAVVAGTDELTIDFSRPL